MKSISSRQNAWFKRFGEAIREHRNEIVIEGPKAVADAIAAGWRPVAVAAEEDGAIVTIRFTPELLRELSRTQTSQGILGLFERPQPRIDFDSQRTVVALDGVQDPGNVGTIVRLAAAFDAAGVVLLPGCADAYAPKAIRASAGAILIVPVLEMTPDELLAHDRAVFFADADGDPTAPPQRATIVFGSEGRGVSGRVRRASRPIAVATSGKVESLNVAASAAILLWQAFRSPRQ